MISRTSFVIPASEFTIIIPGHKTMNSNWNLILFPFLLLFPLEVCVLLSFPSKKWITWQGPCLSFLIYFSWSPSLLWTTCWSLSSCQLIRKRWEKIIRKLQITSVSKLSVGCRLMGGREVIFSPEDDSFP